MMLVFEAESKNHWFDLGFESNNVALEGLEIASKIY